MTASVPGCTSAASQGCIPWVQADGRKLLKHFKPHFNDADPSLEQASALFTTFCFQKQAAAVAAGPPLNSMPEPTPRAGA